MLNADSLSSSVISPRNKFHKVIFILLKMRFVCCIMLLTIIYKVNVKSTMVQILFVII